MPDDWEIIRPKGHKWWDRPPAQRKAIERKRQERKEASAVGEVLVQMLRDRRKRNMAKKKASKKKGASKGAQGSLYDELKLGKEDDDGFAPIYDPEGGETFEFKEVGDTVEGIFYDHFVNEGGEYGPSHCYKVYDVDDEVTHLVWGTFVLDKSMAGVKPGTYIRVTYKGKAGRAHNFDVGVSKALTKENAKTAKMLLAKVAAIKEGNKDVPF